MPPDDRRQLGRMRVAVHLFSNIQHKSLKIEWRSRPLRHLKEHAEELRHVLHPLHVLAYPLDERMCGLLCGPLALKMLKIRADREHRICELMRNHDPEVVKDLVALGLALVG